MKEDDMVKMIRARIKTEYDKYHNSPVDFIETSALKIVATLRYLSEKENKIESEPLN